MLGNVFRRARAGVLDENARPPREDARVGIMERFAASHVAMTREYARAPRGERAHGPVPRNAGTVTTMIGALDLWGVRAMMTVEGATDAEVFETFAERILAKKLRPGDIVVLDNVGAHRTERVREVIRATGRRRSTCRRTRRT